MPLRRSLRGLAVISLVLRALAQGPAPPPVPAFRIEGRVVDTMREPIPLADVWVVTAGLTAARTKTDAEGRFAMAKVPPGPARVFAAAPGHTTGIVFASVDALQPAANVELCLYDGVVLSGTVTDEDGKPVAGAKVMAQTSAVNVDPPCAATDAEGHYRLAGVPLGHNMLCAFAPGFQFWPENWQDLRADLPFDIRLCRGPSTTVRFRITGASKELLASARCWVIPMLKGVDVPMLARHLLLRDGTPGPDGVWEVAGLPRDESYLARVQIPAKVTPISIGVAGDHAVNELDFAVVAPARLQLRGNLVDRDDKPVPGCALRCRNPGNGMVTTATTAADGSFTIESSVQGAEKFILSADDQNLVLHQEKTDEGEVLHWGNEFVSNYVPDSQLRVVAVAAAELRGRIVTPAGRPVFGAGVRLMLQLEHLLPPFQLLATAFTDRQGRFTIYHLNGQIGRPLHLETRTPFGTLLLSEVKLPAQGTLDLGDLQMIVPAEIEGVVTDENDQPVPGAHVRLGEQQQCSGRGRDLVVLETIIANRDGRYRFVGLAPGRYQLDAITGANPDPKYTPSEFELGAGEKHEETLRLAK